VNTLISGFPADGPQPPILPPRDGFLFLDKERFHESFAGDVPADEAAFMADSQVPWGLEALGGPVTQPAWRSKPSWYLVATDDRMIPPVAQRSMAERGGAKVTEAPGSHAIYVSRPEAVADDHQGRRRRSPTVRSLPTPDPVVRRHGECRCIQR
jgi:pimeloyl-ACP methyl ester carboxylesterase